MRDFFVVTVAVIVIVGSTRAAEIPSSWKGELQVDTEIPTVSLNGALVMVKTGGPVSIDASQGNIQGKARLPYQNDFDHPSCTARVRGFFVTAVSGTYAAAPVARPEADGGRDLNLQVTRTLEDTTDTISCPPQPPVVVPMKIAPATVKLTLPMKHKAGFSNVVDIGPAKLHNAVTLSLPCEWDATAPPGPKLVFDNDPREPTFASGIPNQTLTIAQLTGLVALSRTDTRSEGVRDLGLVKFGGFNFEPHVHVRSAPARHMSGKSCVWIDSIDFTVRLIEVYAASDLVAAPACNDLVLAHEDRHFKDAQSLLKSYANELARQLKSLAGPHDARLYDNPTDGEARLGHEATDKITAIEEQYGDKWQRAKAQVDTSAESDAARRTCSRFFR